MSLKMSLVILCWFACCCDPAPRRGKLINFAMIPERNPTLYPYNPQFRPFFGSIGDWITNTNWLPIEVNVPETITNIVNGISGITVPISSGITGLAQRIPFIHRLTSAERPRPLQYFVVIPSSGNGMQNRNDFNPFVPGTEIFPHYP